MLTKRYHGRKDVCRNRRQSVRNKRVFGHTESALLMQSMNRKWEMSYKPSRPTTSDPFPLTRLHLLKTKC